jgi:hypothetical protein
MKVRFNGLAPVVHGATGVLLKPGVNELPEKLALRFLSTGLVENVEEEMSVEPVFKPRRRSKKRSGSSAAPGEKE